MARTTIEISMDKRLEDLLKQLVRAIEKLAEAWKR